MKDPEFRKLWEEYAESLQDPAYRKEEEEYLKQVEEEAKAGGDHSFQFVIPKEEFVVKLKSKDNKKHVFLNMCSCDKVEEHKELSTVNGMSNWQVPVTVGNPHEEDHEGQTVIVYDAVYHPKTIFLANRSDGFCSMLVDIAIDNINQGHKKNFENKHLRQPSSIVCIGRPKPQTVRAENKDPKKAPPTPPQPQAKVQQPVVAPAPTPTPAPTKPQPKNPTPVAPRPADPTPKYTVLHKHGLDLLDAWNFTHSDRRIGVPTHIIVRIELPGISASEIDVDVGPSGKEIRFTAIAGKFSGTLIPLPFEVNPDNVSAKFEKGKHLLTLTLTVRESLVNERVQEEIENQRRSFEESVKQESEAEARRKEEEEQARREEIERKKNEEIEAKARKLKEAEEMSRKQREFEEQQEKRIREAEEARNALQEKQDQWRRDEEQRTREAKEKSDREEREKEQAKQEKELQKKLLAAKEAEKHEAMLKEKQTSFPLSNVLITLLD
eukprot:PhF_6_TR40666/c0_g1_i1/m.61087/K19751/DNAAF2, KTU, PF13; dynein assembly factor 2, axonemal